MPETIAPSSCLGGYVMGTLITMVLRLCSFRSSHRVALRMSVELTGLNICPFGLKKSRIPCLPGFFPVKADTQSAASWQELWREFRVGTVVNEPLQNR